MRKFAFAWLKKVIKAWKLPGKRFEGNKSYFFCSKRQILTRNYLDNCFSCLIVFFQCNGIYLLIFLKLLLYFILLLFKFFSNDTIHNHTWPRFFSLHDSTKTKFKEIWTETVLSGTMINSKRFRQILYNVTKNSYVIYIYINKMT